MQATGRAGHAARPVADEREHFTDDEYAEAIRAEYRRGRRRWSKGERIQPGGGPVVINNVSLPPGMSPIAPGQLAELAALRTNRRRIL